MTSVLNMTKVQVEKPSQGRYTKLSLASRKYIYLYILLYMYVYYICVCSLCMCLHVLKATRVVYRY